jgi:hypothetical protein
MWEPRRPTKSRSKFIPVLNEAPRREDVWGSGNIFPLFFTSTLELGEWSASRYCLFTLGETSPGTYHTGKWMGLRLGLL